MTRTEYKGMSYEQASREAYRLIQKGWFRNFDALAELHQIMITELRRLGVRIVPPNGDRTVIPPLS